LKASENATGFSSDPIFFPNAISAARGRQGRYVADSCVVLRVVCITSDRVEGEAGEEFLHVHLLALLALQDLHHLHCSHAKENC
jgi:hypothetical protein